ncbi:thioredoxin domain-containing protein 17-like [Lineus longissimus]|uniref:thioredoxin domain-containing protein 17-like n=1 Tax=Lineus longissimus TaxID=88925 RepID=UPI002B4D024B
MCTQLVCNGYDEFKAHVAENKGKTIFAFFTGAADALDNESWCPDCVKADPVIESKMSEIPEDAIFILCAVGTCEFWKDKQNAFRTDADLKLTCVPTLVKMGKDIKKLGEAECANGDLVSMLFTED